MRTNDIKFQLVSSPLGWGSPLKTRCRPESCRRYWCSMMCGLPRGFPGLEMKWKTEHLIRLSTDLVGETNVPKFKSWFRLFCMKVNNIWKGEDMNVTLRSYCVGPRKGTETPSRRRRRPRRVWPWWRRLRPRSNSPRPRWCRTRPAVRLTRNGEYSYQTGSGISLRIAQMVML